MVAVVPDHYIYERESQEIRKHLVEKDLLDTVIDLPGWFISNQKRLDTTLLIIKKQKNTEEKNNIRFIDAVQDIMNPDEEDNFYRNRIKKLSDDICEALSNKRGKAYHALAIKTVGKNQVIETGYDLYPPRYTHPVLEKIDAAINDGEPYASIRTVCKLPAGKTPVTAFEEYPLITLDHLSDDPLNYMLDIEKVAYISDVPATSLYIIDPVLILSSSSELRPTYTEPGNEGFYLSNDLHALIVEQDKVDLEYLIFQMHSDIVKQQLMLHRKRKKIVISDILNLKIPVPSIPVQQNMVGRYKEEIRNKYLLSGFINDIHLVTSNMELKEELERFVKEYFPEGTYVEYKTSLEFEDFPFDSDDLAKRNYFKFSVESQLTSMLLLGLDDTFLGAIITDYDGEIAQRTYSEINSYANFLMKLKEHITQKVVNDNLARFAHTSKNFFSGIQGEMHSLIEANNKELRKALSELYIDDEEFIMHKVRKDRSDPSEYIALNKLRSISERIAQISGFYIKTDETFKNIINTDFMHFDLLEELKHLHSVAGRFDLQSKVPKAIVFAKKEAVKQAFVDLIQNSNQYSADGNCQVKVREFPHFYEFAVENLVDESMTEERYNKLGRQWLRSVHGNASSGIYWAFQSIEDSYGYIEVIDFKQHIQKKIFSIKIKLKR
jgi:hypothetical protein